MGQWEGSVAVRGAWEEGEAVGPVMILLFHPPNSPTLTHHPTDSHVPTLYPLIHSTGIMPYHQHLVQLSQLVPSSEKMLSVISEPILLQDHCDSLIGPRIQKIELIMDDYTCKLPCKFGAH